jgi:hypothetical protein
MAVVIAPLAVTAEDQEKTPRVATMLVEMKIQASML